MRIIAFIFLVAIGIGALVYVYREPLILDALSLRAAKTTLADHKALIAPSMQFRPPEGATPPYPAVIFFHGCSGMRQPFMDQWSAIANEAGFMAIIVDSHSPRGIDRARALKSVCGGKELIGQERAGDVLAAYEIVRTRSDVDPSTIALAGWSHGAWSVMDFIAMDPPKKRPAGIRGRNNKPHRVAGAILIYPYCGPGAWSRIIGWRRPVSTLAIIAGADTIVDPKECPRVIGSLNSRGAGIDMEIYPQADHAFDDPFLEAAYQYLYSADAHADEARRFRTFLETLDETR
ncbi:MAG: dienelactone hydrolase family protein [Parvularculaceae bacterium]